MQKCRNEYPGRDNVGCSQSENKNLQVGSAVIEAYCDGVAFWWQHCRIFKKIKDYMLLPTRWPEEHSTWPSPEGHMRTMGQRPLMCGAGQGSA
jgi:hypothetical protein